MALPYIRANLDKCINLNEGMGVSTQYKREGGGLDKEGKGTKQEEMSPGTRPQLQSDRLTELVGAKYR